MGEREGPLPLSHPPIDRRCTSTIHAMCVCLYHATLRAVCVQPDRQKNLINREERGGGGGGGGKRGRNKKRTGRRARGRKRKKYNWRKRKRCTAYNEVSSLLAELDDLLVGSAGRPLPQHVHLRVVQGLLHGTPLGEVVEVELVEIWPCHQLATGLGLEARHVLRAELAVGRGREEGGRKREREGREEGRREGEREGGRKEGRKEGGEGGREGRREGEGSGK